VKGVNCPAIDGILEEALAEGGVNRKAA